MGENFRLRYSLFPNLNIPKGRVQKQITFFKVVYRRHTNFALEAIEQTFTGTVDFGRKVSCTVSRNGDLIHKVYLQVDLPSLSIANTASATIAWDAMVGHNLIDTVYIEIGGQTIDTHYGDWLNIWNELTQSAEKEAGYNTMIGNTVALTTVTDVVDSYSTPAATLYVPLQFWFCRNPGLALPLIALQYHEVKFNITFSDLVDLYTTTGSPGAVTVGNGFDASLYIDYIYLDTDERRQFAQVQHEYLIEQLQFTGAESVPSGNGAIKSKLALNHPCKELVWVIHRDTNELADYSNGGNHTVVDAKLQLNGQDRFSVREGAYFNLVQPYQHHTRIPAVGIYVYSFALNPEQHQPSGTVNMSRIDNATLQLSTSVGSTAKLRVYAVNYNVLRIMAGMGGLAYSN